MIQNKTVLTTRHLKQTLLSMRGNGTPNLYRLASDSELLHWRVVEKFSTPNEYSEYQRAQVLAWILIWGIEQFSIGDHQIQAQEGQIIYTMLHLLYVYGEPRQALYYDPEQFIEKYQTDAALIHEIKYRSKNQINKMLKDAIARLLVLLQCVDATQPSYSDRQFTMLNEYVLRQRYGQLDSSAQQLARQLAVLRKPLTSARSLYSMAWRELEQRCLIVTTADGIALWEPLSVYLPFWLNLESEHQWAASWMQSAGTSAENTVERIYHLQQARQAASLAQQLLADWEQWLVLIGPTHLQDAFHSVLQLSLDETIKNKVRLSYAQLLCTHIDLDKAIEQYEMLTWTSGLVAATAHLWLAKSYRAKQNSAAMLNQFRYALAKLPPNDPNTVSLRGQILAERAQYWIQEGRAFEQAEADLNQVELLMAEIDSAEFAYEFYRMQGTLAGNQHDFAATEHYFWQAWKTADKTNNSRIKMHAQVNLGMSMLWHSRELAQGAPAHAEGGATMLMSALTRAQTLNDLNVQKACLKSLADHAVFANRHAVAIDYYQRAIEVCEALSDEIWIAVIHVDLTEALCAQGNIEQARQMFQATEKLVKEHALHERLRTLQAQFPWLTLDTVSLTSRQQKAYHHLLAHGRITRADYMRVASCKARQASYDLTQMVEDGWLEKHGQKGRGVHYTRKLSKQTYVS